MALAPLPPDYPGSRLLGNTRALLRDTGALLTDGYRRLGPIFRLRVAWMRYTVIAGDAATDFMTQGLDEAHLTRHGIFDAIQHQFGPADLVLGQSGERHTRLRAPLAVAYSRQVASPFVPAMIDAVRRHLSAWAPDTRVSVIEHTRRMAFEQYRQAMDGGEHKLDYRDAQLVTDYGMNVGGRLLPTAVFRTPWYRAAHRRAFTVLHEMVRAHRRNGPRGTPTILDSLMNAHDIKGAPLTDDEAVTYCAYGLAASSAYIGRLVAFMLYEILRDEDLKREVTAEAAHVFEGGFRDAAAARGLTVLRSVYQETLRAHPISPGMPFDVPHDFEFRGTRIPRGDTVVVCPVPHYVAPDLFPEPQRFDPARCREPRNEHHRLVGPFGLGNRTCVAMGLVELIALTQVATLLHDRDIAMDHPGYRLTLTVRPLPAPHRRFRMRVTRRTAPPVPSAQAVDAHAERALATFPGHDDPHVRELLARATPRHHAPGDVIIREGDQADRFYLLVSGGVHITRRRGDETERLADLGEGEWFGEMGLLNHAPRAATVTAGGDGAETLTLDRATFLGMVAGSDLVASEMAALLRRRAATMRLRQVAPQLDAVAAQRVLPEFAWRACQPGDIVIRQGEAPDAFYVIVHGEVRVVRRVPHGHDEIVATLGAGEYFGEIGLLFGTPRNATVVVGDEPAGLLVADRAGFERLIGAAGGAQGELARAMRARVERLG